MIEVVAEFFAVRGVPGHLRSDNGPGFIAKALQIWLEKTQAKTWYIAPGAPWENGYAESFHSRLRDELLNVELSQAWRKRRQSQSVGSSNTTIAGRTAA